MVRKFAVGQAVQGVLTVVAEIVLPVTVVFHVPVVRIMGHQTAKCEISRIGMFS